LTGLLRKFLRVFDNHITGGCVGFSHEMAYVNSQPSQSRQKMVGIGGQANLMGRGATE
jgi:hypothetical protein